MLNLINLNTSRLQVPQKTVMCKQMAMPSFNGGVDFVLINRAVHNNPELRHIEAKLISLGVKELTIGDNLPLARLVEKILTEVRKKGFEIPQIIKFESSYFKRKYRDFAEFAANRPMIEAKGTWEPGENPTLRINTNNDIEFRELQGTKREDNEIQFIREIGRTLHMSNFKDKEEYFKISELGARFIDRNNLNNETNQIKVKIGDMVPEFFHKIITSDSLNDCYPAPTAIYKRFRGPEPK